MQIVIDIPDEEYENVKKTSGCYYDFGKAIVNGTPLPKGATNGDVIKAVFPDVEIKEIMGSFDKDKLLGYRTWLGGHSQDYLLDWWNAPYKTESSEK